MNKNNFKIKIISAILCASGIVLFNQNAQALDIVADPAAFTQFATHITTQRAWEFAREAYTRTIAGASTSAITASTDAVRATQEIQIKQAEFNQKDTDQRLRKALGEQAIAQRDIQATPTLERCVELTAALSRAGAAGASRSGGNKVDKYIEKRLQAADSVSGAAAASIDGRQDLGACTSFEADNKITNCSAVGSYPGGDHKADSLFINRDTSQSKTTSSVGAAQEIFPLSNFTLNLKGQNVAERFIANVVTSKAPIMLSPEQAKKAPGYMSLYYAVTTKIDIATHAFRSIVAWRYEPSPAAQGSASYKGFLTYWNASKAKYEEMFGGQLVWPANPSEYEMLHFEIMKNYADVMSTKTSSSVNAGTATDKQILEQAILNNYLTWLKIKQGEDTNSLLAGLLANNLSPMPLEQLEAERIKAQSAPK